MNLKESLTADETVKSYIMSDVLIDAAKWLAVDVPFGRKLVEYICVFTMS
jgi:hypothetical protein